MSILQACMCWAAVHLYWLLSLDTLKHRVKGLCIDVVGNKWKIGFSGQQLAYGELVTLVLTIYVD